MGMLSGKYDTNRPQPGDVRLDTPWWDYFDADTMPGWLQRLDTVRELLTVGGRTLVQGALGYLLALDRSIIPLPGIRTVQQARETPRCWPSGHCRRRRPRRPPHSLRTLRSAADRSRRKVVGGWFKRDRLGTGRLRSHTSTRKDR
jgi:hypothetical protein